MSNVYLSGIKFDSGTNRLIAGFGNDLAYYSSGWNYLGVNMPSFDMDIIAAKNYAYMFSPDRDPISIDSSLNVSSTVNLTNAPRGRHPHYMSDRIYVGKVTIGGVEYSQRCYYTDIIVKSDKVRWGLEYGTDMVLDPNSRNITSASAAFISSGIKIGDDILITTGNNAASYVVEDIVSETELYIDRKPKYYDTASYIVGSNWFDISGAYTGIGEHYGTLLNFTYNQVERWSFSIGKRPIYGVRGTSSPKSIVSNHEGYTFWYHPSDGIIMYNGDSATSVTNKINDVIDAVQNHDQVIGWPGVGKYKQHVYFYIGNITLDGASMSNVIIDYNIGRNTVKLHEYNAKVVSAAIVETNNVETTYLGTDASMVLQFNNGTTDYNVTADDGSTLPIAWYMQTHPIYPSGQDIENIFDTVRHYTQDGVGIKFQTRQIGIGERKESEWQDEIEIKSDFDICTFPTDMPESQAIEFRYREISKHDIGFKGHSLVYSPTKLLLEEDDL